MTILVLQKHTPLCHDMLGDALIVYIVVANHNDTMWEKAGEARP